MRCATSSSIPHIIVVELGIDNLLSDKLVLRLITRLPFTGELEHALNLSKPKFVFVSPVVATSAVKVCKKLSYVKNVILIEGRPQDKFVLSLDPWIRTYQNSVFNVHGYVSKAVDIHKQTCLIFCSSGTTGLPKGVETTQANVMSCLQTSKASVKFFMALQSEPGITNFNIAPWFHVLGFISMVTNACSSETTLVYLPKFEERLFYQTIEVFTDVCRYNFKVTYFHF